MFRLISVDKAVKEIKEANRGIDFVVIHHTGVDTPFRGMSSWETIDKFHRLKGWRTIGYHFGISPEGNLYALRPAKEVGAHCKGHNAHSVGVVLWGDGSKANPAQYITLAKLLVALGKEWFFHSELRRTKCPALSKERLQATIQRLRSTKRG